MTAAATPVISIIGGGFSGAMVLANIVRLAERPLDIEWFDQNGIFGPGLAYSTVHPSHRLNVRARHMEAYADKPEDFARWLSSEEGRRAAQKMCPDAPIGPDDFVPRLLYGEYILSVLAKTKAEAARKNIGIWRHSLPVFDIGTTSENPNKIIIKTGRDTQKKIIFSDAAVLATGNGKAQNPAFPIEGNNENYIADVWKYFNDKKYFDQARSLSQDALIAIIGTSLTMVDVCLALEACGYKGRIVAISRKGMLPATHTGHDEYPVKFDKPSYTALELLRTFRTNVSAAEKNGKNWRAVMNVLRPQTTDLWRRMNTKEQRRFIKRLLSYWGPHRHRMAPEIYRALQTMLDEKRLEIIAGRVGLLKAQESGLTLSVRKHGENKAMTLAPALIFDCTGVNYDISAQSGLLKTMKENGILIAHPNGMGIELAIDRTAKGKAEGLIHPIGNLLIGEELECIAVPELRIRAAEIAENILKKLQGNISSSANTKNGCS